MKKKLLTVVFPTFNREAEVKQTLNILRSSFTSIDYEVIICDNSPTVHKYGLRDNEYCFRTGRNMGAAARNLGIEKASAPYILMLDDDSHPLPGSIENALESIIAADNRIAGVTAKIVRPDGGEENPPLLPTAFHGCGVLFKKHILHKHKEIRYPESFCFYGEEYFLSLLFYKNNYTFIHNENFIVCHRMTNTGRDKAKIIYYLTRNNKQTWDMVPEKYYSTVMYDTSKRYQLIAEKENVKDAFEKAMNEAIVNNTSHSSSKKQKMTKKQFEDFSLISLLRKKYPPYYIKDKNLVLCGCGKFPTLWASVLKESGPKDIIIADTNPAFINKQYGDFTIFSPTEAVRLMKNKNYIPIYGHNARYDTSVWLNKYLNFMTRPARDESHRC